MAIKSRVFGCFREGREKQMSNESVGTSYEKEQYNREMELREKEFNLKERQFAEEFRLKQSEQRGVWKGIERGLTIAIPLLTVLIPASISYTQFLRIEESKVAAQSSADQSAADAARERAKADRITSVLKARSAFAAKKVVLYEKAVKVTGDLIVTKHGTPEYREARKQFELLYWSQLPLVEDSDVAGAMVTLRNTLAANLGNDAVESAVIGVSKAIRISLKDLYEPDDTTVQVTPVPDKQ